MNKPTIVLIGAGGHARSCIDVIEQQNMYRIAGLIGLADQLDEEILGYKVIGSDTALCRFVGSHRYALIALGQIKTATKRIQLFEQAKSCGYEFKKIISPSAYVSSHASIGSGTVVMAGAVINAGAVVGDNCIVNSNTLVEHDVIVDNHCHISTAAVLNGSVKVGSGSFVGSGAHVKEGVFIGADVVVEMGANVRHDISSNS